MFPMRNCHYIVNFSECFEISIDGCVFDRGNPAASVALRERAPLEWHAPMSGLGLISRMLPRASIVSNRNSRVTVAPSALAGSDRDAGNAERLLSGSQAGTSRSDGPRSRPSDEIKEYPVVGKVNMTVSSPCQHPRPSNEFLGFSSTPRIRPFLIPLLSVEAAEGLATL